MIAKGKKGQKQRGVVWRRNTWWIRWTCTAGHKHYKVVGAESDDQDAARLEVASKRREVKHARAKGQHLCPKLTPHDQPVTFGELLDRYVERRDESARDEAERAMRRRKDKPQIDLLRARFGNLPAQAIKSADVRKLYADLRARTVGEGTHKRAVSLATANRYMKRLHAVLRLGVKGECLPTNPAGAVALAKENNARVRCLTEQEETRLRAALPEWFRPLVEVALRTGMRRGELLALRWTDVDLESGSVRIRRDKAGDGRWTMLSPEALGIVRAIKRRKVGSSLVFCTPFGKSLHTNFQRVWETARRRAHLPDFRFHDLRHTFASRLTQRGVDSYVIQRAGGWRTPIMMQRYAHLDPRTIKAAVSLLDGNGHQNGHQQHSEVTAGGSEVVATA
jgi:integrase